MAPRGKKSGHFTSTKQANKAVRDSYKKVKKVHKSVKGKSVSFAKDRGMVYPQQSVMKYKGIYQYPERLHAKFIWSDDFVISQTVGDSQNGLITTGPLIVLNSPNFPSSRASTAVSPTPLCRGWQQVASQYKVGLCKGAKVMIEFYNPIEDGQVIGYKIRTSLDPSSAWNGDKLTVSNTDPNCVLGRINNTGSQIKKYTFYVDNAKMFGYSKEQYKNGFQNFTPDSLVRPVNFVALDLGTAGTTGIATTIRVKISVIFYTELFGRDEIPIQTIPTS